MLAHPSETASQASRGHSPKNFRHLHKDYDANPTSVASCCVASGHKIHVIMVYSPAFGLNLYGKCRYKYTNNETWILWVFCVTCFFFRREVGDHLNTVTVCRESPQAAHILNRSSPSGYNESRHASDQHATLHCSANRFNSNSPDVIP